MSAASDFGEAEFPFDKQTVFNALVKVISRIEGMRLHSSDKLSGRVVVKAGMSLFSWGENIPIALSEQASNRTLVRLSSTPKTGGAFAGFVDDGGLFVGGNMDFGKNRKNIERIFSELSSELSRIPPVIESEKKKCPFCAEPIQREAIKCRFCGSDLREAPAASEQTPDSNQESASEFVGFEGTGTPKRVGNEVHFECHTCGQPMVTEADAADQEFRCPECGEHLIVPRV